MDILKDTVELDIKYFFLEIVTEDQFIDLDVLAREFKLSVKLNPNKTMLIQDGVAVSKSFIDICKPNKNNKNITRPTGFTHLQYPKRIKKTKTTEAGNITQTLITRPPTGPIPRGAWCTICTSVGPRFHKETCSDPVKENLNITLYGFVSCVLESNKKGSGEKTKLLSIALKQEVKDYIRNTNFDVNNMIPDNIYKKLFEKVIRENDNLRFIEDRGVNVEEEDNEWPLLKIKYLDIVSEVGPKKRKRKSYYSNCVMISYNFGETRNSVSIRIYQKGKIILVSCPWIYKEFYKVLINSVNQTHALTEDLEIHKDESSVKTTFSSIELFENHQLYAINLDNLYQTLWPLDSDETPITTNLKKIFTKQYTYSKKEIEHSYLKGIVDNIETYYRYSIEYRNDLDAPKIILRLLPCVMDNETNIPKYCKPYKITVMIFKKGTVQLIFSHCYKTDEKQNVSSLEESTIDKTICDEIIYTNPQNLSEQFNTIENELQNAKQFIINIFKNFNNDNDIFYKIDKSIGPRKRDTLDTVQGIFPYKKLDKYKKGTKVDVFDTQLMEFTKSGVITGIVVVDKEKIYTVKDSESNEIIGNLTVHDLRQSNPKSTVQLSRAKISGTDISNRPNPYNFKGECEAGKGYFVPFGGTQGRDNLFYPTCEKLFGPKKKLYIDQILNGFPLNSKDESDYIIEKDDEFDIYSGTFIPGTTDIGKEILVTLPEMESSRKELGITNDIVNYFEEEADDEGYLAGIIKKKRRIEKKTYDNYVIYTIQLDSGIEIDITGKEFHPQYREKRQWSGVNGNTDNEKKNTLLNCTKKLGLSQSPFTKQRLDLELQTNILNDLNTLFNNTQFPGKKTIVLTPSTMKKFTNQAYMGLGFPKNTQRVIFFINNSNTNRGYYFIDETKRVMKVPYDTDMILHTSVIDGYILRNKEGLYEYYAVDCLYYRDKKLRMNYIVNAEKNDDIDDIDDLDKEEVEEEDLRLIDIGENEMLDKVVKQLKYGRLFHTIYISILMNQPKFYEMTTNKKIVNFNNPIDYTVPYFNDAIYNSIMTNFMSNPWDIISNNNIIEGTKKLLNSNKIKEYELLFIPQSINTSYLRWKRLLTTPVVLQLIKNVKGKDWIVGIKNDNGNYKISPINDNTISILTSITNKLKKNKNGKFLRFNLNFMTNGNLNIKEPLLLHFNPMASKDDAFSHDRTQLIISAMIDPINIRMFENNNNKEWNITTKNNGIQTLHIAEENPGTSPLIEN
jgi:hypothetical protein